jgi:hypothetical protein
MKLTVGPGSAQASRAWQLGLDGLEPGLACHYFSAFVGTKMAKNLVKLSALSAMCKFRDGWRKKLPQY